MIGAVQDSEDLRRILRIPRRAWSPAQITNLVERLSSALRTPTGCQDLKPLQATALAEIAMWRGAWSPLPTGSGKTLLSLLAPRVLRLERPLLLLPAHLIEKTITEERGYRADWVLPAFRRIESYETLSRVSSAKMLSDYAPDGIILDEAHAVKNPQGPRWRRIKRYLDASDKHIPLIVMTGTPTGKSIRDFSHLLPYCVPRTNPTPMHYLDLDEWARALDCDVPPHRRLRPGALLALGEGASDGGEEPETYARRAFRSRLRETPGIVMSEELQLPVPIRASSEIAPLGAAQEEAIAQLRRSWITPDGEPIEDAVALWRHAREISMGFYSVWDPRPPDDWRDARRAWHSECRDVIGSNRREIDTAEQLAQHLRAHPDHYPRAASRLAEWRRIEPAFVPTPSAVWIDDTTIDWVAEWARANAPAWIWTDRPCVGERLRSHGLPYYGAEGVDAQTGLRSEDHDPRRSAVLSRRANSTGRNLQFISRNLITDVPASAIDLEQLVARTHRPGQRAACVDVTLLIGTCEDVDAFWKSHTRALYSQDLTGQPQKICHADLDGVLSTDEAACLAGPRWKKSKPPA